MVDERADDARIPEIHSQLDAWISGAFAVPILDVDGIAQEWLIYRLSIVLQEQEMKLMDVEGMQFPRPIFDDPVLYVSTSYEKSGGERRAGLERA